MDHRDAAPYLAKWIVNFDEQRMTVIPAWDEDEKPIPVVFEVCPTCDGKGSHVNPSIDAHGISPDEFREDPDFAEDYFRGTYDVPCAECRGRRVVPQPANEEDSEKLNRWYEAEYAYIAECEAERRMGA